MEQEADGPPAARGQHRGELQLLERNRRDAGWRVRTARRTWDPWGWSSVGVTGRWEKSRFLERGGGGAAWQSSKVIPRSISSPGAPATEGGICYPYRGKSKQDGSLT